MKSFKELYEEKYRSYGGYPELRDVQVKCGVHIEGEDVMEDAYDLYLLADTIVKKFVKSQGKDIIDDSITMIDAPENIPFHKIVGFGKVEGMKRKSDLYKEGDPNRDYILFFAMIQFTDKGMEISVCNGGAYRKLISDDESLNHSDCYEQYIKLYTSKILVNPDGTISQITVRNGEKSYDARKFSMEEMEVKLEKFYCIRRALNNAKQKKNAKK